MAVRQAATVAATAFADATIRLFYVDTHGPGLRGGRFTHRATR